MEISTNSTCNSTYIFSCPYSTKINNEKQKYNHKKDLKDKNNNEIINSCIECKTKDTISICLNCNYNYCKTCFINTHKNINSNNNTINNNNNNNISTDNDSAKVIGSGLANAIFGERENNINEINNKIQKERSSSIPSSPNYHKIEDSYHANTTTSTTNTTSSTTTTRNNNNSSKYNVWSRNPWERFDASVSPEKWSKSFPIDKTTIKEEEYHVYGRLPEKYHSLGPLSHTGVFSSPAASTAIPNGAVVPTDLEPVVTLPEDNKNNNNISISLNDTTTATTTTTNNNSNNIPNEEDTSHHYNDKNDGTILNSNNDIKSVISYDPILDEMNRNDLKDTLENEENYKIMKKNILSTIISDIPSHHILLCNSKGNFISSAIVAILETMKYFGEIQFYSDDLACIGLLFIVYYEKTAAIHAMKEIIIKIQEKKIFNPEKVNIEIYYSHYFYYPTDLMEISLISIYVPKLSLSDNIINKIKEELSNNNNNLTKDNNNDNNIIENSTNEKEKENENENEMEKINENVDKKDNENQNQKKNDRKDNSDTIIQKVKSCCIQYGMIDSILQSETEKNHFFLEYNDIRDINKVLHELNNNNNTILTIQAQKKTLVYPQINRIHEFMKLRNQITEITNLKYNNNNSNDNINNNYHDIDSFTCIRNVSNISNTLHLNTSLNTNHTYEPIFNDNTINNITYSNIYTNSNSIVNESVSNYEIWRNNNNNNSTNSDAHPLLFHRSYNDTNILPYSIHNINNNNNNNNLHLNPINQRDYNRIDTNTYYNNPNHRYSFQFNNNNITNTTTNKHHIHTNHSWNNNNNINNNMNSMNLNFLGLQLNTNNTINNHTNTTTTTTTTTSNNNNNNNNNINNNNNNTSIGRNDQGYGEYSLIIENVQDGTDTRTTLMIRNIPNKYTQHMLLNEINVHNKGLYDFFYLPIDFKNKCNMGYAFINFINYHSILYFYNEFNNQKWSNFNSEKVCAISYARLQGKSAMITRFQNSSLLEKHESYRPLVFCSHGMNQGKPEPFPTSVSYLHSSFNHSNTNHQNILNKRLSYPNPSYYPSISTYPHPNHTLNHPLYHQSYTNYYTSPPPPPPPPAINTNNNIYIPFLPLPLPHQHVVHNNNYNISNINNHNNNTNYTNEFYDPTSYSNTNSSFIPNVPDSMNYTNYSQTLVNKDKIEEEISNDMIHTTNHSKNQINHSMNKIKRKDTNGNETMNIAPPIA